MEDPPLYEKNNNKKYDSWLSETEITEQMHKEQKTM